MREPTVPKSASLFCRLVLHQLNQKVLINQLNRKVLTEQMTRRAHPKDRNQQQIVPGSLYCNIKLLVRQRVAVDVIYDLLWSDYKSLSSQEILSEHPHLTTFSKVFFHHLLPKRRIPQ